MPELPEVEFVARALNTAVSGMHIESAVLLRARLAPDSPPADFADLLKGRRINFVHRRGKNILFDLDNGRTLLTHLRMSGRFMLLSADTADPKFTHAVFHLGEAVRLAFQDQRHFGLMKVLDTADLSNDAAIAKLAPEPFSEDFSVGYLSGALGRCGRSLKEFLLDQTKVCGLGNIYASEAMFLSRLSPRRKACNVPRSKIDILYLSVRDVLNEALVLNSTRTPDPVVIGEGAYGEGVGAEWLVYGREGHPCRECATLIRRIRQGQRSTYYCPKCQR